MNDVEYGASFERIELDDKLEIVLYEGLFWEKEVCSVYYPLNESPLHEIASALVEVSFDKGKTYADENCDVLFQWNEFLIRKVIPKKNYTVERTSLRGIIEDLDLEYNSWEEDSDIEDESDNTPYSTYIASNLGTKCDSSRTNNEKDLILVSPSGIARSFFKDSNKLYLPFHFYLLSGLELALDDYTAQKLIKLNSQLWI